RDSFLLAGGKGVYGFNTRTLKLSPHPMNSYLTDLYIKNVLIDPKGNIWAGSWESGLAAFYKDNPNFLSEQHMLQQNFPNPFNSMTQIEFYVPEAGNVQIKLFDITGREVMVLLDEQKAAGSYFLRMNGSRLPSGVYIYTVRSGSFTDSKKLLLIK
ncbi:MAG: T9SS type A sorting domain-containing protein, partial [Syntrophothermus sp.]